MTVWNSRPLIVGHRGGRGEGWPPENGLEAFERARREGAAAVELDVRTAADEVVVVAHDETLERVTDHADRRRVCEVSADDLQRAGIPGLETALAWARGHGVAVNVEMKNDVPSWSGLARRTARIVRRAGADVLFSSFDPRLVAAVAVLAPAVPRALLVHAGQPRWADRLQRWAGKPYVEAVHLERTQVDADAVAHLRRRGLRVGVWTVNDPAEARRLLALGVSTIITDAPGVMLGGLSSAVSSEARERTQT